VLEASPATKTSFLGGIDIPERGFGVLFASRILERLRLRGLFVTDKKYIIRREGRKKKNKYIKIFHAFCVFCGKSFFVIEKT